MIRMTNGFTYINGTFFDVSSGEFEAGAEIEQHLVSQGVAAYAQDSLDKAVATPQDANGVCEAGENTTDETGAQSGTVGHLDAEQLSAMTNAQLKKLAEDMGLDTSKCKRKADFIDLITAEEVIVPETDDTENDGELPPELSAEAPVV